MNKIIFCIVYLIFNSISAQNRFSKDSILRKIYAHQYNFETNELIPYLTHKNHIYRKAASIAFASNQDSNVAPLLIKRLKSDKNIEVKNAALYSLSQLNKTWITNELIKYYHSRKSKSVRPHLLEAIAKSSNKTHITFFENIKITPSDSSIFKPYIRSMYFIKRKKMLNDELIKNVNTIANNTHSDEILTMCYIVNPKIKPNITEVKKPIKSKINNFKDLEKELLYITNPYEKLNLLIDNDSIIPNNYFWVELNFNQEAQILENHYLETYYKRNLWIPSHFYVRQLNSQNISFISLTCEKIRKDSIWKDSASKYITLLNQVIEKLTLPRDFETLVDLKKTISQLEKKPFIYQNYFQTGYNNPIDWNYINKIPFNQKVKLTTTKGIIILECKINSAPASTCNFLKLVDSGFYNNKYFHRMVPNFVVQGGCPRGDGWGSLNWIQKSEFTNELYYKPGSVGLASAGKDSEGVQFFITHTYTSNLDGRYTIFAEVIKGMDVVNNLVMGDKIISIEKIIE